MKQYSRKKPNADKVKLESNAGDIVRLWLKTTNKGRDLSNYLSLPLVNVFDNAISMYSEWVMKTYEEAPLEKGRIMMTEKRIYVVHPDENVEVFNAEELDRNIVDLYKDSKEKYPTYTFIDLIRDED